MCTHILQRYLACQYWRFAIVFILSLLFLKQASLISTLANFLRLISQSVHFVDQISFLLVVLELNLFFEFWRKWNVFCRILHKFYLFATLWFWINTAASSICPHSVELPTLNHLILLQILNFRLCTDRLSLLTWCIVSIVRKFRLCLPASLNLLLDIGRFKRWICIFSLLFGRKSIVFLGFIFTLQLILLIYGRIVARVIHIQGHRLLKVNFDRFLTLLNLFYVLF